MVAKDSKSKVFGCIRPTAAPRYWIPACAGMTSRGCIAVPCLACSGRGDECSPICWVLMVEGYRLKGFR